MTKQRNDGKIKVMMSLKKQYYFFLLITLVLLSLFLRVYHLGNFSLFSDERSSALLGIANTNQGGMGDLMRPDKTFTPQEFWAPRGIKAWFDADSRGDVSGNSLVHDMMLKLFAFLFGKSDESIRGVSVMFNMLTVWILFRWSRQFSKSNIWTLLIVFYAAIEPFFVVYSQQARNYSTSLFFTTASNYFFWILVIKRNGELNRNIKYLLFWVITSIGALFSTYLTVLSIVGQFIYVLFFVKDKSIWLRMSSSSILIFLPIVAWFIWGPARNFYQFQADAAEQLLAYIHQVGEVPGWLELSTPSNLFKRTISIWSDYFVWTNDLYIKMGYKIGAILLLIFAFLIYKSIASLDKAKRGIYLLGVIQILLPVFFLFVAAVNAGTTSGFFLRYACFGLPFGIFLSVRLFEYSIQQSIWIKIFAILFLTIQSVNLIQQFLPLYSDKKQKYTYSVNRGPNPYPIIAAKIEKIYELGDTIVYPSWKSKVLPSKHTMGRMIDPVDAQNVNFYFNPNAQYIQRVDAFMHDSILIKRKNGDVILIFDFKNGKYRY